MNNSGTIRLILGIAIVAGSLSLAADVSGKTSENIVQTDSVSVEWNEAAAWAYGRYALAGLELPDGIEIRFHQDPAPCDGRFGLHHRTEAGSLIEICLSPIVDVRRVLLHELAHAWAAATLDDAKRDAFVDLRGVEARSSGAQWNLKGTEHAAEIVAWAVDEQSRPPGRLADHDVPSLTEAFVFLTDAEPICDIDATVWHELPPPSENRRGGEFA